MYVNPSFSEIALSLPNVSDELLREPRSARIPE
jgi:hypothetical protein